MVEKNSNNRGISIMFDFINNLFRVAMNEMRHLRLNLMYVIFWTVVGVVLLLVCKPTMATFAWFTLVPWLASAYFLFSIQRFIRLHIAGEGIEFLGAMSDAMRRLRGGNVETREQTGAFDNEFIRNYISVISNVFLVQTALFLLIPLYVNYTLGGKATAIIIVMLCVIVAIDNFASFRKISRFATKAMVISYVVGLTFVLFPHAGFYLGGLTNKVDVISVSAAKKVNDLDKLQKEQQEKIDNDFLDGVIAWQKAHPGSELPKEYKEALNKARQLGKLKSLS